MSKQPKREDINAAGDIAEQWLRRNMAEAGLPWFPAWKIEFDAPVDDPRIIAAMLLENRQDDRWLVIGEHTPVSERHLWATWLALKDRIEGNTAISKTLDGEFIRLLSGTHQMSLAFKRAGLRTGSEKGWLVRLPNWENNEGTNPLLPENYLEFEEDAYELMCWIGADLSPGRPFPLPETSTLLELKEWEGNSANPLELALLTRLAVSDLD